MDDTLSYPPIDPTCFDLIVIGTGLPESILAAAASAAGKTVLHLDPNPFYGGHFSSLTLDDFTSFLHSQSSPPSSPPSTPSNSDHITVDLTTRPIYSAVEISSYSPEPLESRKFNLDLAGPRVLFCAESAVDLMLKSGASQYVEFKSVDASFICDGEGKLSSVPDSRSAIFKDTSLGLSEKTRLGSFFKLVEGHLKAVGSNGDESSESRSISEEDLERPFVEFLNKMRLPPKIKSIILYAIAMADYNQDNMELCKDILKTKNGINRLALYHSSVGRFSNALGAMIYPIYGQGELPQAFCRRAAVKGCLYVLRMPVKALLINKDTGRYRGVKVTSGQELFSHQMVLGPSFIVPNTLPKPSLDVLHARFEDFCIGYGCGKVARGICITTSSIKPDVSTLLVVYPPKSLHPEQVTSIRILQIGSNLAVCPSGMFISYLSSLCDDAALGKKSLHAAANSIFSIPTSGTAENSSSNENESAEAKPTLLWSALYVQEMAMGSFNTISTTPTPDGNLNYNDIVDATKELFLKMFPGDEFFPETSFVDPENDAELDQSRDVDLLDS